MIEVLRFVFEDFWRFLQCCILLMIFALWKPIEINILHGYIKGSDKKDEDVV